MRVNMPTELMSLRNKIDSEIQNVWADNPPNVAFVEIWHDVKTDYESLRQVVHQYLSCLLDETGVRATVASRTKTPESISKSINRREDSRPDGQKYQSPSQILDHIHDLVGLKIVVEYPSGLERSSDLVEATFQTERYNSFSANRAVGRHWTPRFGAYESRNYLVWLGLAVA
jgi:ppGpp synthetase/RelA/SpoT-type nucleotidyltranferase